MDDILRKKSEITLERCIPRKRNPTEGPDYVSLYGCRGPDPRAFFMNPWEFVQWWKPIQLQQPSKWYKYTKWTPDADQENPVPGVDYVLVAAKLKHEDILMLPARKPASKQYETLRHSWVSVRRELPITQCRRPFSQKKKTVI